MDISLDEGHGQQQQAPPEADSAAGLGKQPDDRKHTSASQQQGGLSAAAPTDQHHEVTAQPASSWPRPIRLLVWVIRAAMLVEAAALTNALLSHSRRKGDTYSSTEGETEPVDRLVTDDGGGR